MRLRDPRVEGGPRHGRVHAPGERLAILINTSNER